METRDSLKSFKQEIQECTELFNTIKLENLSNSEFITRCEAFYTRVSLACFVDNQLNEDLRADYEDFLSQLLDNLLVLDQKNLTILQGVFNLTTNAVEDYSPLTVYEPLVKKWESILSSRQKKIDPKDGQTADEEGYSISFVVNDSEDNVKKHNNLKEVQEDNSKTTHKPSKKNNYEASRLKQKLKETKDPTYEEKQKLTASQKFQAMMKKREDDKERSQLFHLELRTQECVIAFNNIKPAAKEIIVLNDNFKKFIIKVLDYCYLEETQPEFLIELVSRIVSIEENKAKLSLIYSCNALSKNNTYTNLVNIMEKITKPDLSSNTIKKTNEVSLFLTELRDHRKTLDKLRNEEIIRIKKEGEQHQANIKKWKQMEEKKQQEYEKGMPKFEEKVKCGNHVETNTQTMLFDCISRFVTDRNLALGKEKDWLNNYFDDLKILITKLNTIEDVNLIYKEIQGKRSSYYNDENPFLKLNVENQNSIFKSLKNRLTFLLEDALTKNVSISESSLAIANKIVNHPYNKYIKFEKLNNLFSEKKFDLIADTNAYKIAESKFRAKVVNGVSLVINDSNKPAEQPQP